MTRPTLSVLIVEDEAVLAMDLAMIVEDNHHQVVGEAASLAQVEALPPDLTIDLAFVDVQLLDGSNGVDVARLLRTRAPDATIVFVTANPRKLPPDAVGALGYISKPFTRAGMMQAIGWLAEMIGGGSQGAPPPSCLVAIRHPALGG